MTTLQGVGLGALQGLTEFLPVSSSGHLVLARGLMEISDPALPLVVLVHAGSLVAIGVFFWRDIVSLLTTRRRLIPWLVAGSVPAALVYVVFNDTVELVFSDSQLGPLVVGFAMLVTGTVLVLSERWAADRRSLGEVTWVDAVVVGVAQAVALLPGISRSGMTIGSGLARGLRRRDAVTFAFLLGAVAIGGSTLVKCRDLAALVTNGGGEGEQIEAAAGETDAAVAWGPAAAAFAASAAVSLASLVVLTIVVRRKCLAGFAIYCYAVGGGVVLAKLTGLW